MVTIRRLLTILLFVIAVACVANAQTYERQGNTFVAKSTRTTLLRGKLTKFKWQDSKGNEYPVYISPKGSCYVIKKNTKDEDKRHYLGPEISSQICKELGREYKGRRS